MNAPTNHFQTIMGADGKPAFVVMPYAEFLRIPGTFRLGMIPHTVVSAAVDGKSMLQAWREYLHLTQAEVAKRMGITQAGYAQIESAKHPRKATLLKAAEAMGITLEQLAM